jgi:hypothetical protein
MFCSFVNFRYLSFFKALMNNVIAQIFCKELSTLEKKRNFKLIVSVFVQVTQNVVPVPTGIDLANSYRLLIS